jgi:hypothetical protein
MGLQEQLSEIIEQHQITEDGGCACGGWVGAVPHSDHVAAWLVAAVREHENIPHHETLLSGAVRGGDRSTRRWPGG